MATWAEVEAAAIALPGVAVDTTHRGAPCWKVSGRMFAWDRPLNATDRAALNAARTEIWTGGIVGLRTVDLDEKEFLLADEPAVCFTIPHLDGYAAVLVRLEVVEKGLLGRLVTGAWRARAPKTLLRAHPELAAGPGPARV